MENNTKQNILLFDFFGVISSEVAPFWFERYFEKEEAMRLKNTYCPPADTGEITQRVFFQTLANLIHDTPEQVEADWHALVHIDQAVVEYIRNARNRFRIALCSNAPSPFLRRILKDNNLESLFDLIIISSEIGLAKPDTAFFTRTLELLDAEADNATLIDDNPSNIDAAHELGIRTLLFSGISTLDTLR